MSLLLQTKLLDNGAEILESIIADAKDGDGLSRKLLMDRLIPRLKPAAKQPIVELDRAATSLDTALFGSHNLQQLEEFELDLRKSAAARRRTTEGKPHKRSVTRPLANT